MNFLTVIGGLIGLFVAGVRGLLVGGLVGYVLTRLFAQSVIRSTIGRTQAQFLDSAFSVMGAMCKADGQVTEDEIRVAETLFDQVGLSGEAREAAKQAFNRGKAADFDLDAEVRRFAEAARGQRVLHQMFIQVQLSAIAADGALHPAEHAMLLRIARGLGMSAADVEGLEALLRGGGGSGRRQASDASTLDDAYRALGVGASATDAEVKRAYRLLMSQNHPDKLAAKGLPESMRAMAEEKTRVITVAYERIEKARRGG